VEARRDAPVRSPAAGRHLPDGHDAAGEGAGKAPGRPEAAPAIEIRGLGTRFGEQVVHNGLDLVVRKAETLAIVGGSGAGKSTLLREMILLHRADAGSIQLLGEDVGAIDEDRLAALRRRIGVLFQYGGLFASMTVAENVALPLEEFTHLPPALVDEVVAAKIALAGLPPDAGAKRPADLSGGMVKRAALARALALDPELLFLDEPTAGLDPVAADAVGRVVVELRALLGLTVVVITHDIDLLWQIADRVAVLGRGRVVALGSMDELSRSREPEVRPFFEGARGRAAAEAAEQAVLQAARDERVDPRDVLDHEKSRQHVPGAEGS
jgi:phospholipid/cholesterol/gamma-HCH transport system ATP-binding protein